jgi:hypothetical protein
MLVSYAYNEFSLCFHFCLQSASMHKHADICMCIRVYYSNNFDLHKIWVMQNLQEQIDCTTQGAPAIVYFKVTSWEN